MQDAHAGEQQPRGAHSRRGGAEKGGARAAVDAQSSPTVEAAGECALTVSLRFVLGGGKLLASTAQSVRGGEGGARCRAKWMLEEHAL